MSQLLSLLDKPFSRYPVIDWPPCGFVASKLQSLCCRFVLLQVCVLNTAIRYIRDNAGGRSRLNRHSVSSVLLYRGS
jgi:hypothetical protein